MPLLQVDLSEYKIKSLTSSLFKLHKLKNMILHDNPCFIELPHEIGNLESVELLDLQGTNITKLQNEVGKLSILRNLQISLYGPINNYKGMLFN